MAENKVAMKRPADGFKMTGMAPRVHPSKLHGYFAALDVSVLLSIDARSD